MNEIIFSNYKFKFALNDTTLNIQIYNIINNNLFEGTINDYEVKSVNKFYKLILNALNKIENFYIKINEEYELIKISVNYNTDFGNIEEFFTLNKVDNNKFYLLNKIDELEKNIAMLVSHNEQLEQQIKQYENKLIDDIDLVINIVYSDYFCCDIESAIFYQYDEIVNYGNKNEPFIIYSKHMLDIIFNKITINFIQKTNKTNNVINYTLLHNNPITALLTTYASFNNNKINQIIINGVDNKNKIKNDIIETLGTLTNYKELHINNNQLENHCKKHNIKFVKIEN